VRVAQNAHALARSSSACRTPLRGQRVAEHMHLVDGVVHAIALTSTSRLLLRYRDRSTRQQICGLRMYCSVGPGRALHSPPPLSQELQQPPALMRRGPRTCESLNQMASSSGTALFRVTTISHAPAP